MNLRNSVILLTWYALSLQAIEQVTASLIAHELRAQEWVERVKGSAEQEPIKLVLGSNFNRILLNREAGETCVSDRPHPKYRSNVVIAIQASSGVAPFCEYNGNTVKVLLETEEWANVKIYPAEGCGIPIVNEVG